MKSSKSSKVVKRSKSSKVVVVVKRYTTTIKNKIKEFLSCKYLFIYSNFIIMRIDINVTKTKITKTEIN